MRVVVVVHGACSRWSASGVAVSRGTGISVAARAVGEADAVAVA